MIFQKGLISEFEDIKDFYWNLIDEMEEKVLIPHALAVIPKQQGSGVGKKIVEEILQYARSQGKKAVRLDILGKNEVAEKLYTKCGFKFVQAKTMFYEDTGWTEYKMYELKL